MESFFVAVPFGVVMRTRYAPVGNALTSNSVVALASALLHQRLPCMSIISTPPCRFSAHFKVTIPLAGLGERVKSVVSMGVMPTESGGVGVGIESMRQGLLQSLQPVQIPPDQESTSHFPRT